MSSCTAKPLRWDAACKRTLKTLSLELVIRLTASCVSSIVGPIPLPIMLLWQTAETLQCHQSTPVCADCLLWCRGHAEDVQDLAWSADCSALASGSVENLCIVWDTASGTLVVNPVKYPQSHVPSPHPGVGHA